MLVAVSVGVLVLCIGLVAWRIGASIFASATAKDDMAVVLDRFMRRMADKDPAGAYALFSSRARKHYARSAELERLDRGANYAVFEGYRTLAITSLKINAEFHSSSIPPQGTVAEVNATLRYAGGSSGDLEAVLEMERGGWMLASFNVTVPPEKISASSHSVQ